MYTLHYLIYIKHLHICIIFMRKNLQITGKVHTFAPEIRTKTVRKNIKSSSSSLS